MRPAPDLIERPSGPIRLREWVLYADRNLLESDDDSRRLEPKAVDVLALLVARAGDVVSKDELIDRVWESRIISEGTLTNTIAELRRALGDDARDPRFIETIPKRGYRLVCPVEQIGSAPTADGPTPTSVQRWRPAAAAIAIVVGLAVATVALWPRSPSLEPDRILATSFVNRTGERELGAYATLARDRILSGLAESGIARPVSADESAGPVTIDAVCRMARAHGAGLAVTGALYLHEGEIEVQTQLVDVAEGELLYAAPPVIGPRNDVSASIEQAVQQVLGALATHRTAHAHATLHSRPPVFEAYREFIAGSELFTDDLPVALGHLERAVELDPDFTSAQLRLAMGYKIARRGPEGRAILDRLHGRRGELTEFERLWLDAFIANFEGRWADSLAALQRLADDLATDWTVLYMIGVTELALNQPGRAVVTLGKLHVEDLPGFVSRHPLYADSFMLLARAHHRLGNHAAELASAMAGRERFPTHAGLMASEARARAAIGKADGLETLVAAAEVEPDRGLSAAVLVAAAASADAHGHTALATDLANRAVETLERDPAELDGYRMLLLGRALAILGQLDRAQSALEGAVEMLADSPGNRSITATGWLGSIAARRGDLEIADIADRSLASVDDPYLYGSPTYYRAAIAAWRGHRNVATELFREARASGWGRYDLLHGDDRLLFEPLEGEESYRAMLQPAD